MNFLKSFLWTINLKKYTSYNWLTLYTAVALNDLSLLTIKTILRCMIIFLANINWITPIRRFTAFFKALLTKVNHIKENCLLIQHISQLSTASVRILIMFSSLHTHFLVVRPIYFKLTTHKHIPNLTHQHLSPFSGRHTHSIWITFPPKTLKKNLSTAVDCAAYTSLW